MIANEVLPGFYMIQLEGDAVKTIVEQDFGIKRIELGSVDFTTDLTAFSALKQAMEYLVTSSDADLSDAVEQVTYNPEFFPTLPPLELTTEQLEQLETAQAEADEVNSAGDGQVAIPLTRNFDELGDFIETRWVVTAPAFSIIARVGVNPRAYTKVKARTLELAQELPAIISRVSVH